MIDIQEKNNIEKLEKENSKIFVNENIIINNNNQNKDIKEKDYVFSTDVINSILNGTNMEFIDLLFNINKENIKEEELIFSEKINNIIQIISKLENDRCKNKNFNQNKKSESNSKRKKDKKSNSGNKSKINNTFLGNDLNNNKNVKVNYFIKAKIRKSNIFNINDKKMNNSINLKNINNKFNKNEKNFIKKIEYNLFKNKKLISENHTKNILHNISISIKKDLSKSKKNSSNNSKKPSSSASSFNILNNNSSYNNKIKVYNKINPKNKKVKNSIKSPNPLTSRIINNAGRPNFFLDKSWININKMNQTKYNNSTNNIFQI
jgi:Asp-tRNA(Asn)/Glu-tRNA(Gln) amidotransferase C subunit